MRSIAKAPFETELAMGMQRELQSSDQKEAVSNLVKAAEYLQSAMDIMDELGFEQQANQVLAILSKIAQDDAPMTHDDDLNEAKHSHKITDPHTKGLTPQKMIDNLKNHGIVFNLGDDGKADDLLDLDLGEPELEVFSPNHEDKDFEDEE